MGAHLHTRRYGRLTMSKIKVYHDHHYGKVIRERSLTFEHEDGGAIFLKQEIWESSNGVFGKKGSKWYSSEIRLENPMRTEYAPFYAELLVEAHRFEEKDRKHWVTEGVLID